LAAWSARRLLPIEPYYALRYMVTFLVVVSVGGAGSIPGALLACLLLGAIDTTGRYLLPEFGEFFFYLAVIAIVCVFPRGLLGQEKLDGVHRTHLRRHLGAVHTAELVGARFVGLAVILAVAAIGYVAVSRQSGLLTRIIGVALLVLSLDLVTGYCGIATLGHAALFGAGAYASGIACGPFRHHRSAPADGRRGAIGGAVAGLSQAPSFCVATGCRSWCCRSPWSTCSTKPPTRPPLITGGSDGLSGITPDPVFGIFEFDLWGRTAYGFGWPAPDRLHRAAPRHARPSACSAAASRKTRSASAPAWAPRCKRYAAQDVCDLGRGRRHRRRAQRHLDPGRRPRQPELHTVCRGAGHAGARRHRLISTAR
jgi:hypothetical protein